MSVERKVRVLRLIQQERQLYIVMAGLVPARKVLRFKIGITGSSTLPYRIVFTRTGTRFVRECSRIKSDEAVTG
jgi:hypothetical protein